jgi:hypothetical protein
MHPDAPEQTQQDGKTVPRRQNQPLALVLASIFMGFLVCHRFDASRVKMYKESEVSIRHAESANLAPGIGLLFSSYPHIFLL